jgi:hypothetical protein
VLGETRVVSGPAFGSIIPAGHSLVKPHQAAIARGVGTAALGGAFGILTSVVAGGRTIREVIVPALMGTVFWGGLIGISVYFAYKEQEEMSEKAVLFKQRGLKE